MLFTPVQPPRNPDECQPWLHEAIKRLNRQATATNQGFGAILRGEAPDASGNSLIDTARFFVKPGLPGGQVAYGGVNAGEALTLSSTAGSPKGKIYLGVGLTSAYDEVNDRLGIGVVAPSAKLHLLNAALGTSTIGATGTPFAQFGYGSPETTNSRIAPILNLGGVVDVAMILTGGGFQFIDPSITTAGIRFAFSSTRAFIQAGSVQSDSSIANKNLTLGGLNATKGNLLASVFDFVYLLSLTAGGAESGLTTFGVNADPSLYTSSAEASQPDSVLIRHRNKTLNGALVGALILEDGGYAASAPMLEVRDSSTGTGPNRVLGSLYFQLDSFGRCNFYSGSSKLGRIYMSAGTGVFALEDTSNNNVLSTSVLTRWTDSASTTTLNLGITTANVVITGGGLNKLTRLGITTTGLIVGNTTSNLLDPPTGLLHLKDYSGVSTILTITSTHASAQTFSVDSRGALQGSLLNTCVIIDTTTVTKKVAFALSGATAAKTTTLTFAQTLDRTITFPDISGTLLSSGTLTVTSMNLTLKGAASKVPLTIQQRNSGDTSNLLSFNDSTGTLKSYFTNAGDLVVSTIYGLTGLQINDSGGGGGFLQLAAVVGATSLFLTGLAGPSLAITGQIDALGDGALTGGYVDLAAQTTTLGPTTLHTVSQAGFYRLSVYACCSTVGATPTGTLVIDAAWVSHATAQTAQPIPLFLLNNLNKYGQNTVVFFADFNTAVTYTATVATIGTSKYDLRIRLEWIGP